MTAEAGAFSGGARPALRPKRSAYGLAGLRYGRAPPEKGRDGYCNKDQIREQSSADQRKSAGAGGTMAEVGPNESIKRGQIKLTKADVLS